MALPSSVGLEVFKSVFSVWQKTTRESIANRAEGIELDTEGERRPESFLSYIVFSSDSWMFTFRGLTAESRLIGYN